jgi:hypothetical protein
MTSAIVWSCLVVYLGAALAYARTTIRRWAADPKSLLDRDDNGDRAVAAAAGIVLGLCWPLTMVFYVLRDWLWKPADKAHERVEQMRTDREAWRTTQRAAATDEERAAATAIVDALTDLIDRAEGHAS